MAKFAVVDDVEVLKKDLEESKRLEAIRLIDVGARGGIDERWRPFWRHLEVTAFEADSIECDRLNSLEWPYKVRFLPAALGAEDGQEATLKICRAPGCSSLLWPNMAFIRDFHYADDMEVVKEVPVRLSRMDTVLDVQPDMIKIDTQGTELDILMGAGNLLNQAIAVELEVEFVEQYKDQALFADIDMFMRSLGYQLRGLRRTYWRNSSSAPHAFGGQILHGDALYIRPDAINSYKGHIILAAYRQFDLLARFGATDLIPRESMLFRVIGRLLAGISNRELRRLIDRMRPLGGSDWHDPDFF